MSSQQVSSDPFYEFLKERYQKGLISEELWRVIENAAMKAEKCRKLFYEEPEEVRNDIN